MSVFILLTYTLFDGVIPAEWDEQGRPCCYPTEAEAEAERLDYIATWRENEMADGVSPDEWEDRDEDEWIAEVRVLADGTIETTDGQRRWTPDDLRACR